MITFKQFLSERAENMRAYRKVFKTNKDARVGFEVEVFIPHDHEFAQKEVSYDGRSMTDIRRFDTYSEFEDYFNINRQAEREIDNDYMTWIVDSEEKYIKDNLDDNTTEEDLSDMFDEMRDEEYSWTKWFNQNFKGAPDFINTYNLEPRYGWADKEYVWDEAAQDQDSNWSEDIAELMVVNLRRYLNGKHVEYGNVGDNDGVTFMIVPDSSITSGGDGEGYGAEIVTPPLHVEEGLYCLSRIFDFIKHYELKTNSSTGIHINLSIPNMTEKIDTAKLVLLMNDEHVLKQFGRLGNSMTRSQMNTVRASITAAYENGKPPTKKSEVGQLLQYIGDQLLNTGKYSAVNFVKLRDDYLEFRAAGNADYHDKFEEIQRLVGRWLSAIERACDPDMDKDLYLKRLVKAFGEAIPNESNSDLSVIDMLKKMTQSTPIATFVPQLKTLQGKEFIHILILIAEKVGAGMPSYKQMKELRLLMKAAGVTAKDVMQSVKPGDDSDSITNFLKSFRLLS